MRPTERAAYHGRAKGDVEICGPAMTGGTAKARRAPTYRRAMIPSRMRPSPAVKAGLQGSAGLKRNRRTTGSRVGGDSEPLGTVPASDERRAGRADNNRSSRRGQVGDTRIEILRTPG